ncbi:MAG: hypothetical protein ABL996_26870, partial [Micropepsaceae bacterium]
FAAITRKVFGSTDPYPGFGRVQRVWSEARADAIAVRGDVLREFESLFEAAERERQGLVASAQQSFSRYEESFGASQRLARRLAALQARAMRRARAVSSAAAAQTIGSADFGDPREEMDELRRVKVCLKRLSERDADAVKQELLQVFTAERRSLQELLDAQKSSFAVQEDRR